jgi:hypothetical protein
MIEPLATSDNSNQHPSYTILSRSFALSILDQNGSDIHIYTDFTSPIEFFIPQDPNLLILSVFLQNVTFSNENKLLFNLHSIKFPQKNPNLTFSIHFEIHPMYINLSYLLIYKFNHTSQLSSSIKSIDGWSLLCPSSKFHS